MVLVGVVLDLLTAGSSTSYSLDSFRWAFAVQYVLWAVGIAQVLRHRDAARRHLAAHDPDAYDALRRGQAVPVGTT